MLGYFLHSYYAQVEPQFASESEDGADGEVKKPKYDIKFLIEGQIEVLYFSKKELLQV